MLATQARLLTWYAQVAPRMGALTWVSLAGPGSHRLHPAVAPLSSCQVITASLYRPVRRYSNSMCSLGCPG